MTNENKNAFGAVNHSWLARCRSVKFFLPPLLVALIAATTYIHGVGGGFVFDDMPLVETDPFYQSSDTTILDCWKRCYWRKGMAIGQHRPLTLLSFLLNARLTGVYSPGFRFVNLLLHICVSILVWRLFAVLGAGRLAAFFAAALFAVHPLHVEAVTPTSGRAELLCAFFVLLGLLSYIAHCRPTGSGIDSGALFARGALLPGVFLLFACWSKENGAVLLPLCALYDFVLGGAWLGLFRNNPTQWAKGVILRYWALAAALLVAALSRVYGIGALTPKVGRASFVDNPLINASFWDRQISAFSMQGLALCKFFWPETLSHDYSYAQLDIVRSLADSRFLVAIGGLVLLPPFIFLVCGKRSRRLGFFLYLSYIVCVIPAGNFIIPTGTIFGERLFYLPSVFLCLGVVMAVVGACRIAVAKTLPLGRRRRTARMVAAALLSLMVGLCSIRAAVRVLDWKDADTMTIKGVETARYSVKTWNNLAVMFAHQNRLVHAIAACDEALSIYPKYVTAMKNKAYYLIALKRYREAERQLRAVILLDSRDPEIYNKLGGLLARAGKLEEAKGMLERSLSLDPEQKITRDALAAVNEDMRTKRLIK